MKNLVFSSVLYFFCAIMSSAQVTLDELTATEGKSAMTSGFDVTISLSKPNGVIFGAQANNERANLRFGKKFGNFSVIATGGAFKNVPWVGSMLIYNYKFLTLFSWSGLGFSTDKECTGPGWNPNYFFNYEEVGAALGKNNYLAYSILSFTTNKLSHFVVYKRYFPLGENKKFFLETTYDITKEMPMFVLGYKHSFNN